jgi:hypothetical protein
MVWGFCYLRIFKKMHSISGRSLAVLSTALTSATSGFIYCTNRTHLMSCMFLIYVQICFFFFFFFFKLPFPFFAIRLLRYLSVGRFSNSCSLFLCLSVMRRGSGALSPATHAHSTSHSQTYTTTLSEKLQIKVQR